MQLKRQSLVRPVGPRQTIKQSIPALMAFLAFILAVGNGLAHGSLHEAIERKSSQIEAQPDDALLHFERGMLYQEHGDIGPALKDFHRALELEPAYQICHLPLAQLYRDTGNFNRALLHINTFLEQEPENPFGYETRASIFQKTGAFIPAVADLRKMIALKNDNAIRPDDYFNLADGILLAYPGQYGLAIGALEEGVQRLGDIISLQERLVGLEVAAQQYSAALQRIEQVAQALPRQDKWLAKREEVARLMQQKQAEGGRLTPSSAEREAYSGQKDSGSGATPGNGTPAFSPPIVVEIVRGPYLQSGTPTSMVVKWRTSAATNSIVWYGAAPDALNQTAQQSGARINHEITLAGLQPNTRYYYAVGDSNGALAGGTVNHFFKTSPPHGTVQPVRAWVLGDCGTADEDARAVRDGYYSYAGNQFTDLILLLGDNAYDDGTDAEYQDAIFENMYEAKLIQTVMWSTPGNHDYGSASAASQTGPYFDIFTFPKNGEAGGLASGTEAYYSFDYANIHFVVLDSHDSGREPGDPMLLWLENDLDATQQDWIIAFFHHPPYSKGSHDSDDESKLIDMRENVLPILEAAGVDLVLCGHSHSYERSFLLHGHYGHSSSLEPSMVMDGGNGRLDEDGAYQKMITGPSAGAGAVYTVAGSSGKLSNGPLDHPVMYYSAKTLGSLSLEVMGQELDLKFIGVGGEVLDYFTLRKFSPFGDPPDVAVSFPADSAFFPSPAPISFQAQASDSDGTIEQVVFLVNGDSVGVSHSAPYTLAWTPPANGTYTIRARATDNDGNTITSAERTFYVGAIETCSQISDRYDDAEEEPNGDISLSSTDLEMVNDGSDQWVGMRFTGLNIPPNAVITHASIQFAVEDNNNDDPCQLMIYGEASDAPVPFSSSDHDISRRPLTEASVSWQPPGWQEIGDMGQAQQTPNLAPILQEIVDRDGYAASSAIVLIIQGLGRRTAESYDGNPNYAPRLCVEYQFCQPATLTVNSSADRACPGQSVTLSASPAGSYQWSTGATTPQITVQPNETTTYRLTAWDEASCPATAEITVEVAPLPEISLEADSVFFCPGQSVEAAAPEGFARYAWSNGQASPAIFIDSAGTWALTVTDANGCTASATLEALEIPPLGLQLSSSAAGACEGQSVTLNASPAESYLWSTGATAAQIVVQPAETTTFSLSVLDAFGCSATAEITVEVFPLPKIEFEADTVFFCPGQGLEVTAPGGFSHYQWAGGQATPTVFIETPGAWPLTVTDANGCSASATLQAVELPPFAVELTSTTTGICRGESITINASPAESYLWSNGATMPRIAVQPFATTTYTLTAWDVNGCEASDDITIMVNPPPDFEIAEENGGLTVAGLDGPEEYIFQWNTGADTQAILPEASGEYCVTVTDVNACASDACYEFALTGTAALSLPMPWEVYPNPFDQEVHIRPVRDPGQLQIAVFGLLGQPAPFRKRVEEEEIILEFSGLPSGFYTIFISNGRATGVAKMLKR